MSAADKAPRRHTIYLILFVVLLVSLLSTLAILQDRWIGQVSAAEADKMHRNLDTSARQLRTDLNSELLMLRFVGTIGYADVKSGSAAHFAEQYDFWRKQTPFPGLVDGVFLYTPSATNPVVRRYDVMSGTFVDLRYLAGDTEIPRAIRVAQDADPADARDVLLAYADETPYEVIVQPVRDGNDAPPDTAPAYVVISINTRYLLNRVVPMLVNYHFENGGTNEYDVYIVDLTEKTVRFPIGIADPDGMYAELVSDPPDARNIDASGRAPEGSPPPDLRIPLFTIMNASSGRAHDRELALTPDKDITSQYAYMQYWFQSRALMDQLGGKASASTSTFPGESPQPTDGPASAGGTVQFSISDLPAWDLVIRHKSGSLENAVALTRFRNIAISSGILLVLGVSLVVLMLLYRRQQRLARQEREFVAAVSHELRTPLAVVNSAAENLESGLVMNDDQMRRYGRAILTEGRRLAGMVERILLYSGIESIRYAARHEEIDLSRLCEEVSERLRGESVRAGVAISIARDGEIPTVLGDEDGMRSVIENLVSNAVKHGGSGGRVEITLRTTVDRVVVEVRDLGAGIPRSELRRIFDPFYRGRTATNNQVPGSGLGLSLVRKIISAHHGTIDVRSEVGRGTHFVVSLPKSE